MQTTLNKESVDVEEKGMSRIQIAETEGERSCSHYIARPAEHAMLHIRARYSLTLTLHRPRQSHSIAALQQAKMAGNSNKLRQDRREKKKKKREG